VGPGGEGLPPLDVAGRLERLRARVEGAGCDALIVSNLSNVRYLSGFSGSSALLVVLAKEAVLVTDGRYGAQAAQEAARVGANVRVEAHRPNGHGQLLRDVLAGVSKVGLEAEHVSWAAQRRWSEGWAKGLELVPTSALVEALREKKAPPEAARVEAAAAIADAAFARVAHLVHERPTEASLALALDTEMRQLGAEGCAFETIVAAGPNAAEPHHRPSGRRVEPGDLVVLDFGARVDGYCSDMTRSVWAGPERAGRSAELAKAYAVVLASQEAGLAALGDGVPAAAVDRACREVVEAAGWGEQFVHGTGHGVGLDIHEAPALAATSEDILGSGHVVTVEPGVYLPGLGGVRIEDTVAVREDGGRVLTGTAKHRPGGTP